MKNFSLTKLLHFFRYGETIRPVRDWTILLGIAFVLLLVSVGFNVWLFLDIENGKVIGTTATPTHAPSANSITAVQDVFKKRASEEGNYQNTYHFVDPSLPGS